MPGDWRKRLNHECVRRLRSHVEARFARTFVALGVGRAIATCNLYSVPLTCDLHFPLTIAKMNSTALPRETLV